VVGAAAFPWPGWQIVTLLCQHRDRPRQALGNPAALSLTPGQAADITQAAPLLDEVEPDAFIGDKGYDSDALVEKLEQRGITPVIPPKANRS